MGLRPWVYSIAPFLYARAFEQIRNDIRMHKLPVVMVGNGGGYGYGVMGSTHHALEDYGCLLTLSNLKTFVPAFDEDVAATTAGAYAFRTRRLPPPRGCRMSSAVHSSQVPTVEETAPRFRPDHSGCLGKILLLDHCWARLLIWKRRGSRMCGSSPRCRLSQCPRNSSTAFQDRKT